MNLFPPPLKTGDRVALVAPSSPLRAPHRLEDSVTALHALGLEAEVYPSAAAPARDYLSLPDAERARDLNRAFLDQNIRGVFCIRGGYGASRILDLVDYEAIRRDPKIFVGLSDITALHLAIFRETGLCTLHAPMPFRYPELPGAAMEHLKRLLFSEYQARFAASDGLVSLIPGTASGTVVGGNLSLVNTLLSSRYLPGLSGAILFLEDVGETPYRVDRALSALKLAGVFQKVSGVIFGGFTDCGDLARIRKAILTTLPEDLPCVAGFPAGHIKENYGFYHGAKVYLDARRGAVEWK